MAEREEPANGIEVRVGRRSISATGLIAVTLVLSAAFITIVWLRDQPTAAVLQHHSRDATREHEAGIGATAKMHADVLRIASDNHDVAAQHEQYWQTQLALTKAMTRLLRCMNIVNTYPVAARQNIYRTQTDCLPLGGK